MDVETGNDDLDRTAFRRGVPYLTLNARPPGGAGRRFEFFSRWTRTQRIRTAASVSVEAVMVDCAELPAYLRIAEKAKHLQELGMSDRGIARALAISDKTVSKAINASRRQGDEDRTRLPD